MIINGWFLDEWLSTAFVVALAYSSQNIRSHILATLCAHICYS